LKQLLGSQFNIQYLLNDGIIYVGQVSVPTQPDWSYCGSFAMSPFGIKLILSPRFRQPQTTSSLADIEMHSAITNTSYAAQPAAPAQHADDRETYRLKTIHNTRPRSIIGRIPDSIMLLSEQLTAGFESKRAAFLSYCNEQLQSPSAGGKRRYYGYTTTIGAPIYLLGPSSYPLVPCTSQQHPYPVDLRKKNSWHTFLLLPSVLVPKDDCGIIDADTSNATIARASSSPQYEIPIDDDFFKQELGSHLLVPSSSQGQGGIPTNDALQNSRLVAYYFSAHWCGRTFRFRYSSMPCIVCLSSVLYLTSISQTFDFFYVH
jgi:hypothetical protein